MERRTVEVRIGGQSVRVVSSAPEEELHRLAGVVSAKLGELSPPGRPQPPQSILLAAMALAHDLEAERSLRRQVEKRARDIMNRLLVRIDDALDSQDDEEGAAPGR
jgi:cell division protein ZapA